MKDKQTIMEVSKKIKSIVRKQGVVTSDNADKTVVVSVTTKKPHAVYRKLVAKTKRYQAHDSENKYKVGDEVVIKACNPISKLKHFEVESLVTKPKK